MAGNTVKEMTMNFEKLDKFEGHDFRRWQKKMHFLLTTLKVVYVIATPMPELMEDDDTVETIRRRANHLRIEESLRTQNSDKGKGKEVVGPSVNMTEEGGNNKNNKQNKRKKLGFNENNGSSGSNKKPKLECWKCGKTGHFKRDCRSGNKKNNKNVGGSGKGSKDQSQDLGQNLVPVDAIAWWIDDHFALVHGKGSVVLEFSSGKSINLFDVLYVPKLFPDGYDFVYMSSSTVVNSSLWHARLGHVHYKRILEMSKDDLIPAIDENLKKYTTCMLTKITRQPFKSITRKSAILELIHSDLCDFHATPSLGIIHETTAPYTPQQNGVAERKNRAFKEMVNFMLSYSGLSEGFWGEAIAVVRLPDPKRKTFGENGIDCIFVGYAEHSKAYRFYVIEHNESVSINSIIESRDAIFIENRFSSIPRPKDIIPNSVESQRNDHSDNVPSETTEPRRGKRARKAKSYGFDFQLYLVEGSRNQVGSQYSYYYNIKEDPRTYNEAMQSRDATFWKEEIDDEIGFIVENNTRVLSDLPPGCKPLGCKWIFKRKMKVDGTTDKFKAQLVIQGFRQKEGIDYFDTYAPVARITTIRLLLALAAIHNLVIHQMDVKTSFLNGDLDEEVYMKQPKGFVIPGNEHKCCQVVFT
ncbi:zinc finger, CCHC-type containing protein [Tanacetum coccineum]